MKLTIERDAAIKALARVIGVVERRQTIPILGNVLLSADEQGLRVVGTDMDRDASDLAEAAVAVPGALTASASQLHDVLRLAPQGAEISLSFDSGDPRLLVAYGRFKSRLPVLPASDFPVMGDEGMAFSGLLSAKAFARQLDLTSWAMAVTAGRAHMQGVYLEVLSVEGEQTLRAVATDGARMSISDMPAVEGLVGMPGVIVPAKTVREMMRMLADAGDEVAIHIGETKVRLVSGDAVLTSKLVGGNYIDYTRAKQPDDSRRMAVDKDLLEAAVRRALLFAPTAEKVHILTLAVEPGSIHVRARNMDTAEGGDLVDTDFEGEAFDLFFNGPSFLEALGKLHSDVVDICFGDNKGTAGILTSPTDPSTRFFHCALIR